MSEPLDTVLRLWLNSPVTENIVPIRADQLRDGDLIAGTFVDYVAETVQHNGNLVYVNYFDGASNAVTFSADEIVEVVR